MKLLEFLEVLFTRKPGFSWAGPYFVGFLFTMGIQPWPFEIVGFWDTLAGAILTFATWPYLLGLHYSG